MKVAVYTVLFGDHDEAQDPLCHEKNVDYIRFSDRDLSSKAWKDIRVNEAGVEPRFLARKIKILPHLFLQNYDVWIYHDAQLRLRICPSKVADRFLSCHDISAIKHPCRNCIYQEGAACKQLGKDDPNVIDRQLAFCERSRYPRENGLHLTGLLFRRNCDDVNRFDDLWWSIVSQRSLRDQLSFDYCLWKESLECKTLAYRNAYDNGLIRYDGHKVNPENSLRPRRTFWSCIDALPWLYRLF